MERLTMKCTQENGKKVIVRTDNAGLFFGTLKEKDGNEVTLANARKLYYWDGANAPEEIAVNGVANPENCKFTVIVEEMVVLGANQIIQCTDNAVKIIEGVEEWSY